jgi:hypothetical protein
MKIIAVGRYNAIRNYCNKNNLKAIPRHCIDKHSGVYNSKKIAATLGCISLNFAGIREDGKRVWYKGWLAVSE